MVDFLFLAALPKAKGIYAVTLVWVCVCVWVGVWVGVCVCDALVNTITGERKCLQSSNFAYRLSMWWERTLLFLVLFQGHLRSPEVKYWKACKHDNLIRQTLAKLILGMYVPLSEYKKPIDYWRDARSTEVDRGQILKILVSVSTWWAKLWRSSNLVCRSPLDEYKK